MDFCDIVHSFYIQLASQVCGGPTQLLKFCAICISCDHFPLHFR